MVAELTAAHPDVKFSGALAQIANQAITLACDLLALDLDTPATTALAGLPWGATLGDSGPVIRDMVRWRGTGSHRYH